MGRSQFESTNLIHNMTASAYRFTISGSLRRRLFVAMSLTALGIAIACGGSVDDGPAASVPPERVQSDATTAETGGTEGAAVAQTTPTAERSEPASTESPATSAPTASTQTQQAANQSPTPADTSAADTSTATAEPSDNVAQVNTAVAAEPSATRTPPTEVVEEPTSAPPPERDFDVVTLLAPDAIPALNNPGYHDTTESADESYQDDDLVLGIELNGDARAFSVPLLSRHEIVNDVIGGAPVAVTW